MRTFASVTMIAAMLYLSPATAAAQDEEEEQGEQADDIDQLMTSDPERADEPAADEAAVEDEAPPAESDEDLGMLDDERPPGEERPADAPSEDAEPATEDTSAAAKPLSVAVLAGYGHALTGTVNPWSLGFGIRGGYNAGIVYLGARFMYHVGETITVPMPSFFGDTTFVDVSANLWQLGVEAGVDIRAADAFVVRPELGVGFASVSVAQTDTVAYIAPGVALLFEPSPEFFLGLDAGYQYVATTQGRGALGFLATVGMRF